MRSAARFQPHLANTLSLPHLFSMVLQAVRHTNSGKSRSSTGRQNRALVELQQRRCLRHNPRQDVRSEEHMVDLATRGLRPGRHGSLRIEDKLSPKFEANVVLLGSDQASTTTFTMSFTISSHSIHILLSHQYFQISFRRLSKLLSPVNGLPFPNVCVLTGWHSDLGNGQVQGEHEWIWNTVLYYQ
jgi:hypothetical protein